MNDLIFSETIGDSEREWEIQERASSSLAMDGSEMAHKLRDAQDYLENASNGLVHHIPEKSPIMKDIMAANAAMEEVRLCLLAKE